MNIFSVLLDNLPVVLYSDVSIRVLHLRHASAYVYQYFLIFNFDLPIWNTNTCMLQFVNIGAINKKRDWFSSFDMAYVTAHISLAFFFP